MKQLAAFVLALALFAAPTLAAADEWKGPALTQIFDQYEKTILFGE
jgi:hypothetical protein